MQELSNEVFQLAIKEYGRAAKLHGELNASAHESYALILEEYEEALDEERLFLGRFREFWHRVKTNDDADMGLHLEDMLMAALDAAAEWVQVAAMCHKGAATCFEAKAGNE